MEFGWIDDDDISHVKQSTKPHLGESARIFISGTGEASAKRKRITTKGGNDKLSYWDPAGK